MEQKIEKSLKRWLKRRVKVTLGLVVAFMITGGLGFAEEGTTNNINLEYDGTAGASINVTIDKNNNENIKVDEEFKKDVNSDKEKWKIIINRTTIVGEGEDRKLSQGSNQDVDQIKSENNVTINFTNLGEYIARNIGKGGELEILGVEYQRAKQEYEDNGTDKDKYSNYLTAKRNYIDGLLKLMGDVVIQNNGDLINDSSKLEECNIHSLVLTDEDKEAIIGTIINNGNISTTGKTNIGAENNATTSNRGEAIVSAVINNGKIQLLSNNSTDGDNKRHNIYAYSAGKNSLIGYIENNGIISGIKGQKKDDLLKDIINGTTNIISSSPQGDSTIAYVVNNGMLCDADINIASLSGSGNFTVSRIEEVSNTGTMFGRVNIYNRNEHGGHAQISGFVNKGGIYATRSIIINDNISSTSDSTNPEVVMENIINYGEMKTFPQLNASGKEEIVYSVFSNAMRTTADSELGSNDVGTSKMQDIYNYGTMEAGGDTFYIAGKNALIDITNKGTMVSTKENIFHNVSINTKGTTNFTYKNAGTIVAEKSFLWTDSFANFENSSIDNSGIIAAKRILMTNKEHDDYKNNGNEVHLGIEADIKNEKGKVDYSNSKGMFVIVDNEGFISNIIVPNTKENKVTFTTKTATKGKDNKYEYKTKDTEYTVKNVKIIENLFDDSLGLTLTEDEIKKIGQGKIDEYLKFDETKNKYYIKDSLKQQYYQDGVIKSPSGGFNYFIATIGMNLVKTESITKNDEDFKGGEINNHILNGIDNTLLVNDGTTVVNDSIINAYETAIKFDGDGTELVLSNTTVNGGVKIGEKNKDDGVSTGLSGNKSDLVLSDYIIVGDNNDNTLTINGATTEENVEQQNSAIINGGIALGKGNDTLNINGYNVFINGKIDADAEDDTENHSSTGLVSQKNKDATEGNNDILNISGNLNIFNDVLNFEKTNISGDVTIYGRVPDGRYGEIDRSLIFNGGDITVKDGGTLTLRIDTVGHNTGDVISDHALIKNEGTLATEDDGKIRIAATGLGWQTVINLGKNDISGLDTIGEDIGYDFIINQNGDIIRVKEKGQLEVTSLLHTIRKMTEDEIIAAKDKELEGLTEDEKKEIINDHNNYVIIDAKESLGDIICVDPDTYLGSGGIKYTQLDKIYKDILNSGSLGKFKVVGSTDEEQEQSLMEFLNYLQEMYTETPYSFTSELSRKSLGTFRSSIVDYPFMANEDNWMIYGGLTHVDGGTKDTYYGKGYYDLDINTATDVKADMTTTGAYALAEYGHTEYTSTGFVVGGANNKLDLSNGSNSEGDMAYLGAYVKHQKDNWRWIAGAGIQWGDYDSERATQRRRVCDQIEQDENFEAHHHDLAYDVFLEGKYSYELSDNLFLEPHVGGSYTWLKQNSIHEKDRALAIDIDSKRFEYAELEAGVDLKKVIPHDDGVSNIKLGLSYKYLLSGYEDEYLHGKYQVYNSSEAKPQDGFDILVPAKNRGSIEASLKYELEKDSGWLFDVKGSYVFETDDKNDVRYDSRSKNLRDGEWMIGVGIGFKFDSIKDFTITNLFDFDKSEIKPEGREMIKEASDKLNKRAKGTVTIDGHTDWMGTEEYNQKLSERRASAVEEEFKKNVTNENIKYETKGYGETRPIADNNTEEGRAQNRRVEVNFSKNK